jgi:hypothetical protein
MPGEAAATAAAAEGACGVLLGGTYELKKEYWGCKPVTYTVAKFPFKQVQQFGHCRKDENVDPNEPKHTCTAF